MNNSKIIENKEERITVVVHDDCEYDAWEYIQKRISNSRGIPMMPNRIVGKVKCCDGDEYDSDVGVREAYKKADRTHNKLLKATIKKWMISQIRDMKNVDSDIFNEVIGGEK